MKANYLLWFVIVTLFLFGFAQTEKSVTASESIQPNGQHSQAF